MKCEMFQIDAFTDQIFGGNPACIIPLKEWLPDDVLLKLSKENGVAETAFFIPSDNGFHLRWFTPDIEMDLCGHATLATAFVLKEHLGYAGNPIIFDSNSGILKVAVEGDSLVLDFPSRKPVPAELQKAVYDSLNIKPIAVYKSRDYVIEYALEEDIVNLHPDRQIMDQINLDPGGVVATAPGKEADFVSRFFTPQATIFEDPVTGSAHCSLIPFWSEKLGKKNMSALQLSERKGKLSCVDAGERVLIKGTARTFCSGHVWTE